MSFILKIVRRKNEPLKNEIVYLKRVLEIKRRQLHQALVRLEEKDKKLFKACVDAQKRNDQATAKILANELEQLRRLKEVVKKGELLISGVILRLETMLSLGEFAKYLNPVVKTLKSVSQDLSVFMPEVSDNLMRFSEELREFRVQSTPQPPEIEIVKNRAEEVDQIIRQAEECLMRKLEEELPHVPSDRESPVEVPEPVAIAEASTGGLLAFKAPARAAAPRPQVGTKYGIEIVKTSSRDLERPLLAARTTQNELLGKSLVKAQLQVNRKLEDKLYDYLLENNGVISIKKFAKMANVSEQEVERALMNLVSKGKVALTP